MKFVTLFTTAVSLVITFGFFLLIWICYEKHFFQTYKPKGDCNRCIKNGEERDLQQQKPIVVYMSNARIFKSFSFVFFSHRNKILFSQ